MFWFDMAYVTLTEKLLDVVGRLPNDRAQMLRVNGRWEPTSSGEFLRRIAGLSAALEQLGVKPGDRVGLFSPNRPEWHIADFAILGLGAADVPIYFNESPDRIVYILNHAGVEVVFVAGEMQTRRLLDCRDRLTSVKHIICAAAPPDLGDDILRYENFAAATGDDAVAEYRLNAARVTPDQLATIIYTSGTTGEPKGVMLTHNNLSSNEETSAESYRMTPADTAVSFLAALARLRARHRVRISVQGCSGGLRRAHGRPSRRRCWKFAPRLPPRFRACLKKPMQISCKRATRTRE